MRRSGYPGMNARGGHIALEPYPTFSLTTGRIFHGLSSSKSEPRIIIMGQPAEDEALGRQEGDGRGR